jgi:hypothetical protein
MAFDEQGRPVLQIEVDGRIVTIGATAGNVLSGNAPPPLVRQLIEARLQSELRGRAAHGVSEGELSRDWALLQQTMSAKDSPLMRHSTPQP